MNLVRFVTIKDDFEFQVEVNVADERTPSPFEVNISVAGQGRTTSATIELNPSSGELRLYNLSATGAGYVACLLTCGLGSLVKAILECWRGDKRTRDELIACLKAKGHDLAADVASCAVGCLGSAVA